MDSEPHLRGENKIYPMQVRAIGRITKVIEKKNPYASAFYGPRIRSQILKLQKGNLIQVANFKITVFAVVASIFVPGIVANP